MSEEYCGCRHPECTDCYPRTLGNKHGLKDHEMAALVNKVRDALQPYVKIQWVREVIAGAVSEYLEENNLRIDKR